MDLSEKLFIYLKSKIKEFSKTTKKGAYLFTCPNIANHKFRAKSPTATIITGSDKISCLQCSWKGTFYDVIRLLEPEKKNYSDAQITEYLIDTFEVDMYSDLEIYKKYDWALFPIAKNSKIPIEGEEWRKSDYRDKLKWIKWLNNGLNIALNNEKSKVIIVDVDTKDIDESLKQLKEEVCQILEESQTLMQNTPHGGKHYVFQQNSEIPQKVNIGNLKIDTRTEKGYILVSPSAIDNKSYSWLNLGIDIKKIPENVKAKLLELMKVDKGRKEEIPQELATEKTEPLKLKNNNLDGCCNDTFVKLGGMLINKLTIDQTEYTLNVLNRNLLENPMPSQSIKAMIGSLEGYKETEEQTQEKAIYECCKLIATDISAKDILDSVFSGDRKKRAIVDKYLAKFHKEGKLSRRGRGRYDLKAKVEWTDESKETIPEYKYKIPYFNDIAYFHDSDIVLIGAPTGRGKTHIAMNIIREMKKQGIKPYYISLESGSRHEKIANQLKLSPKDYYIPKDPVDNPLQVEIELNSFTIIDWLYTGEDFAATQSIFKHLSDEMRRKGGILIVFTQLKENYDWFAVNLTKSFPRLAARFIYDDETGLISHFQCDKITDPKGHYSTTVIPCEFDFQTKILTYKKLI